MSISSMSMFHCSSLYFETTPVLLVVIPVQRDVIHLAISVLFYFLRYCCMKLRHHHEKPTSSHE
eukprot:4925775-Pyramimonas_sp.AAC.1